MKRFQSILCASLLTFAISATAFAGDIHGVTTNSTGNIYDYIFLFLAQMAL